MRKFFATLLSLSLIIGPLPAARAAGIDGYASQIIGLSNGIMGGSILMKCKLGSLQPSILTYMAGSLVHIAGEILAGKNQAKKQKSQADHLDETQLTMKQGGDYQKAIIEAKLDDERTTLEIIKKRQTWVKATQVVYGIATTLAVLEMMGVVLGKSDNALCGPDAVSHKPLEKAVILAYSSLQAAGGSLKGMAAALAMGALAKFVFKIEAGTAVADKAIGILSTAPGRIAFFGASTAIITVIATSLKKEEKDCLNRIATLEKVKGQFVGSENSITEGSSNGDSGGSGTPGDGSITNSNNQQYALKTLPKTYEISRHCYTNSDSGITYSEAGCKSPIKLNRPKFHTSMDIPNLIAGANSANDLAQSMASGDLGKANVEAAKLASMAGKIDTMKKDLMKQLNDKLVKEGKKPIDIDGEIDRQVAALNNSLNKAQPGAGNLSLADAKSKNLETEEEDKKSSGANTTDSSTAVVVMPSNDKMNELSDIGLDPNSDAFIDENSGGEIASLSNRLENFESNESDISKESDISIFKQVSNRYFLNYSKIFERKKLDAPSTDPQLAQ